MIYDFCYSIHINTATTTISGMFAEKCHALTDIREMCLHKYKMVDFWKASLLSHMKTAWASYVSEMERIKDEQDSCKGNMGRQADETDDFIRKLQHIVVEYRIENRLRKDF